MRRTAAADWRARALCRGTDPNAWFPPRGATIKEQRELCARCPVSGECLEAGVYELAGVWGGTSERQRRRIRTERGVTLRRCVGCNARILVLRAFRTVYCTEECKQRTQSQRNADYHRAHAAQSGTQQQRGA